MKEIIENLIQRVKSIQSQVINKDTESALETAVELEEALNELKRDLDITQSPNETKTNEELVEMIINNSVLNNTQLKICGMFGKYEEFERAEMERAFSILDDVGFRLSEDEDDETIEERKDRVSEAMYDYAYSNDIKFEDGEFWIPSTC